MFKYLLNEYRLFIFSSISCYIFSISALIVGFTIIIFLLYMSPVIGIHCAEKAKLGMN